MSACCPARSRSTSHSGSRGASRTTVSQYLVKRYTENSQADSQSPCDCMERFGWEAWTRTRIARSRVWSPTDWTTSQQLQTLDLHHATACRFGSKGPITATLEPISIAKADTLASPPCMKSGLRCV